MTADSRARYAELLHAPAGTTAASAAAAFLGGLPGEGFLPTAEQVAAANALAGTEAPTGRDADVERLLRDEVEAFAAGFWTWSPAERLTIWADLSRRGADATRLRELEPGLDVDPAPQTDPMAGALAARIRTLFVLPPRARAICRNMWLREHTAELEEWRAALTKLQRTAPELVALEPSLRAVLAEDFALAAFLEGAITEPIPSTHMSPEVNLAGFTDRVRDARPSASGGGWSGLSTGWAIVAGLVLVGKIIVAMSGSSSTSKATPQPVFPPSGYPAPTGEETAKSNRAASAEFEKYLADSKARRAEADKLRADRPADVPNTSIRPFTPTEVAGFLKYERETFEGDTSQPPTGYTSWRIAGRPAGVSGEKPLAQDRPTRSFAREQIQACQDYEQGKTLVRPAVYDYWKAAGQPGAAGIYPIKTDPE